MQTLPTPLASEQLALRSQLPPKPAPALLTGRTVRLAPLDIERDAAALYAISNGQPFDNGSQRHDAYDADELIWRFMFGGPFPSLDDFVAYLRPQVNAANALCLCAFDLESDQPVGMANLMNNSPADLKIELGGIWYTPAVQRTPINTESTYLMLAHCFALGYRRVEWKCHSLNERSRRAALRMGFRFEGVQENHMIVKNRNRDTAWYRILDHEWPEAQRHLEALLYGNC